MATSILTEGARSVFLLGVAMSLLLEAAAHHRHFSQPDLPAYPADIVECDVFNPIAAVDALAHMSPLAGVFSNSDHLQTVTALAAAYSAC